FDVMRPYMTEQFYNPSAAYDGARQVRVAIDEARHELAIAIGAKRDEVVLTAGATESINLAFQGLLSDDDHVVVGATEHQAVRSVASLYGHSVASCDTKGIIHPDDVQKVITDKTKLVSITAADSEIGSLQPLSKIAEMLEGVRRDRRARNVSQPLYLHSDASQAAGVIDLHVARLGVDLLSLNAAKCYGPKQVGLLWVNTQVQLKPLIVGGGQERGLRSGTENVAGIVGFALALRLAEKHRRGVTEQLQKLRDQLQRGLIEAIPELVVNGSKKKRSPGHLNVSLDGLDAERVVFHLDSKGVMVATGAACAANKGTRSTVLTAIGLSDSLADGSLRFSLGRQTTKQQIDEAVPLIVEAIRHEAAL
ncbi:MAG: cysteine desulfurase family protein, partial [Candidatus Saccharimonadales bacterium]